MAKIKRSHRAVLAMARTAKVLGEIFKMDEEPEPMDLDDVCLVLKEMQEVDLSNVERFVM